MGFLHAGELLVQAAVQVRQLLVLQAHEMQDRRVQIMDVDFVLDGIPTEFVRGTMN